jgi:ABC-type phosphate/phosphonate transport system substrate-binding protein
MSDPIFALIEAHKTAFAACNIALRATDRPADKEASIDAIAAAQTRAEHEDAARWELATTAPTSVAGLLALLEYVADLFEVDAEHCFAEDDLINILFGTRECLLRPHKMEGE